MIEKWMEEIQKMKELLLTSNMLNLVFKLNDQPTELVNWMTVEQFGVVN